MVLDFKVNGRLVVGMTINFFMSLFPGLSKSPANAEAGSQWPFCAMRRRLWRERSECIILILAPILAQAYNKKSSAEAGSQ